MAGGPDGESKVAIGEIVVADEYVRVARGHGWVHADHADGIHRGPRPGPDPDLPRILEVALRRVEVCNPVPAGDFRERGVEADSAGRVDTRDGPQPRLADGDLEVSVRHVVKADEETAG